MKLWRHIPVLILSATLSACALDKADPNAGKAAPTPPNKNMIAVSAKTDVARTLDWEVENSATSQKASNGQSLAHRLALASRDDLLKKLIAKPEFEYMNTPDNNGRIPLHFARTRAVAALLWNQDVVSRDLYHKKKIETAATYQDKDGNMPVHLMAWRSDFDATAYASEMLCDVKPTFGAHFGIGPESELNVPNNQGRTPLHMAMLNGDEKTLLALFRCLNLDTTVADNAGQTPLHLAARLKSALPTAMLLSHLDKSEQRSATKAKDNIAETPLHIAYRCLARDTQWELINAGASTTALNNFSKKPDQVSANDYYQTFTNSVCGNTIASPALQ